MSFFLRGWWKKVTRKEQAQAYIKTFETPEGTLVLHDLAARFHMLTTHDGSPFAEGQRSVVLHITNLINFTEEDFKLLSESEHARQGDDL